MKNIAIIPARSGSKGLVDKNILEFNGLPLLAYSVKAALESCLFTTILITSDSENYISIAKKFGANSSVLRDPNLSTDHSSTIDVIIDALEKEKLRGNSYDYFTLLQPTSPLRKSNDIVDSYEILNKYNADFVVSVTKFDKNINTIGTLENLSMKSFMLNNLSNARRQDEKLFYINGSIYTGNVDLFLKTKTFYNDKTFALIMPKERSIDIDDIFDFKFAELVIKEDL